MIRIENVEVMGWEHAIRGMRNPMNSWDKSDSVTGTYYGKSETGADIFSNEGLSIGPNDLDLMKRLAAAGSDHRKFMRMIAVYCDITAPLYWWKEFDTYKVGTVANSCSTMHTIHQKDFTLEDFSHDHMWPESVEFLEKEIIPALNTIRYGFVNFDTLDKSDSGRRGVPDHAMDKKSWWWQMIQLLPSSYNQKRTVMLNYEVLRNMYHARKNHKLDEWQNLCHWIETLPYSGLITGKEDEADG